MGVTVKVGLFEILIPSKVNLLEYAIRIYLG